MQENICRTCDGAGMLSDDEGWQYNCSVCRGDGKISSEREAQSARVMSVDDNNRLLD